MAWTAVGQLGSNINIAYVNHGATATVARPANAVEVFWDGSVAPNNRNTGDRWFDSTNNVMRRWNGTRWVRLGASPVVQSSGGTPTFTPNVDDYEFGKIATQTQNLTVANPTGTPGDMQEYRLRIKANAVYTITWGTLYRPGVDLGGQMPGSTSGGGLTDYVGLLYNADDTKWDLVAVARGY